MRIRTVTALLALVVGLVAGWGNSAGADRTANALTVRVELDATTVQAGLPIRGDAVVTNSTGRTLTITTCHRTWISVGLSSAQIAFRPIWLLCRDAHGATVRPGTTHMPIQVETSYEMCSERPGDATPASPVCGHGPRGMLAPALPPGRYTTTTGVLAPDGITVPTPGSIVVTLTS